MARCSVRYSICPVLPEAHQYEVCLTVERPDPEGQCFDLPAWIPGSYMIREFARHIMSIRAEHKGQAVALHKLDKHTWQAAPVKGTLTLTYRVYAWDLSVRGAHLDQSHAFFNGSSVFLRVLGQDDEPCSVTIQLPQGADYRAWRVATTLPVQKVRSNGSGEYLAAHYLQLIDHPVEMGQFQWLEFEVCGVPHAIAVTGRVEFNAERLCADVQRICEAQIRLFEPNGEAPFSRYLFLLTVVGDGYGGLEHCDSTALICGRDDLPRHDEMVSTHGQPLREGYRTLLGLISHEYFHAWNVKRIRPLDLMQDDLSEENYTRLLWVFEGFTSYFDDLALVRTGLVTHDEYLTMLARTISGVWRGAGRHLQSVAESSFDAWIKYYRQDENAPNAIVSYYTKGSLIALAMDLMIRRKSLGEQGLEDVMRQLWQNFGQTGQGVTEDALLQILQDVHGDSMAEFVATCVNSCEDPPLAELLFNFGIEMSWRNSDRMPWLGCKLVADGAEVKIAQVMSGSPAERAGLSAGDMLVALDGLRVTANNQEKALMRLREGQLHQVHAFRRDELLCVDVVPDAPKAEQCVLSLRSPVDLPIRKLRQAWMGAH